MAETFAADVAIVGGGPAGLGAALALRRRGVRACAGARARARGRRRAAPLRPSAVRHARVRPGAHRPGLRRRLAAQAAAAGVDDPDRALGGGARAGRRACGSTTPDGPAVVDGRRVVLATGVRESSRHARLIVRRPAAGRPDHRHAAGDGLRPGPGAVPPAGDRRHRAGQPVGAADLPPGRHPAGGDDRGRSPARPRGGLWRCCPRLLGHSDALWRRAARDSRPAAGRERQPCGWPTGGAATIACDGVLLTGCFVPEAALVRASHLVLDPGSGGPAVDQFGRCSDPT